MLLVDGLLSFDILIKYLDPNTKPIVEQKLVTRILRN